jgi:hypothetical protein
MSRRTSTYARSCAGKKSHTSRAVALRHVQRLVRKGAAADAYEPYPCGRCATWHVGHRSPRDRS